MESKVDHKVFSRFSDMGPNAAYVEELHQLYLIDPALVGEQWAHYFSLVSDQSHNGSPQKSILQSGQTAPNELNGNLNPAATLAINNPAEVNSDLPQLLSVAAKLINSYRSYGHLQAKINPLQSGRSPNVTAPELDIDFYGLSQAQLNTPLTLEFLGFKQVQNLTQLHRTLNDIYCSTIGFEIAHIAEKTERDWFIEQLEGVARGIERQQQLRTLEKLVAAEYFEAGLHQKYVGHKRFSLQGGETLIPVLDTVLGRAAELGVTDVVIGMAHRGRLNVLVNVVGKSLVELFTEFEDQSIYSSLGSGDVKYHLGFEAQYLGLSGTALTVSLAPNPSHLEFVNPVVEGMVRAKQDIGAGSDRSKALPILIHGDAAIIGQGIVTETLVMSQVEGYTTGGTVHVVVNNQVGFTCDPIDYRSSTYCTDTCRSVDAPILHVNGEDPDAAAWAAQLAMNYRAKFKKDVVIDIYCYRKYGHNEADDPSYTQPEIYAEIKGKKSICTIYGEKLIASEVFSEGDVSDVTSRYLQQFEDAYKNRKPVSLGEGCSLVGRIRIPPPPSGVRREILERIYSTMVSYPEDFTVHPKLGKILARRVDILKSGEGIDWAFAEALAFGSLVLEGTSVRLSGQDCGRGTFSHRHLLLRDYNNGSAFIPLNLLQNERGARFEVYNSPLSESGVMGFEFGYSITAPNSLVLWEAQFGDFANGAQVIIDQFISGSEAKWGQLCGLVLLLPHGYEGQGPEHSSARLERFLQLCAEGNMYVTYPSSAAQYFHLLRRHAALPLKRPLIVMTPKSLLRLPEAAVAVSDLSEGSFKPVIEQSTSESPDKVTSLILLSGKVFYDVMHAIKSRVEDRVAIVRVEELYPFPESELKQILAKYTNAEQVFWVQEEPQNMGAWNHMDYFFSDRLDRKLIYVGRPASASTATGSAKRHMVEQQQIMAELVAGCHSR